MTKHAILIALGDYYSDYGTGLSRLKFVYRNVADLQDFLIRKQWNVEVPLFDKIASRQNILAKVSQVIQRMGNDDWLLVFYSGHGNRYPFAGMNETYCVTFSGSLTRNNIPPLSEFLTEADLLSIEQEFTQTCPQGHLISVLDCCYAYGMYNDMLDGPASLHTVFAASSPDRKTYYDENSLFFKAFKRSWNEPNLTDMKKECERYMRNLGAPNRPVITISPSHSNQTL